MLKLPKIDTETENLISHLQRLASGEVEEDLYLVDDFTLGVNYHNPSLYSYREGDSLYNPVIKALLLLLLRVLDIASAPYLDLLQKLLRPLSFSEVERYLSKEEILNSLENPVTQEATLKILIEKLPGDEATLQFLIHHGVIYSLVLNFSSMSVPRYLDGLISRLMSEMIKASSNSIDIEKFASLVEPNNDFLYSKEHFSNYISALSMVCMNNVCGLSWGARLFRYDFSKLLKEQKLHPEEPYVSVASSYYCTSIGKVPFSWIKPFISALLVYVASNYPEKLSPDYSNEYIMAYQDLIVRLLASSGDSLGFILKFISRPDIDILDIHDIQSAKFFSKVCLRDIQRKEDFFNSHFSDLDVVSGTTYATICVQALVKDEEFFQLLVNASLLSSDVLKNWQKPEIYSLLRIMATQIFSAQYLLNYLSNLVSTYLTIVDGRLSDSTTWNDMKETLHLLLTNRDLNLGVWEDSLSKCLFEMENGRRLTDFEPRVEIEYQIG